MVAKLIWFRLTQTITAGKLVKHESFIRHMGSTIRKTGCILYIDRNRGRLIRSTTRGSLHFLLICPYLYSFHMESLAYFFALGKEYIDNNLMVR